MKTIICFLTIILLSVAVMSADDFSTDSQQNDKNAQTTRKFSYKSSPKLRYHNDKKNSDEKEALGNLKPMLNQVLGGNSNGAPGAIPGGTYSF